MIPAGLPAPPIVGRSTRGEEVSLAAFRGKYVVVYFYPKAFTPLCTRQAVTFNDAYEEISKLGAEVIGISVNDYKTQCSFAEDQELGFPLLADDGREISRAYGVLRKWLPFARRVTFIVDPAGMVAARFVHELRVGKHAEEVLGFLRAASGSTM
jgi:peroxiredoxin Q/BCP